MKNWTPKGWNRCPMCDEWYDPNGDRAKMHEHPEPQSGPPRDAWLASRMSYDAWVDQTIDGRNWAKRQK